MLLGEWIRKNVVCQGGRGALKVRSLGHASCVSPAPLQETQHGIMLINNFILVTIAGTFPAKCTGKRGITVLIQKPMSYMTEYEKTAPKLWGQTRSEALG